MNEKIEFQKATGRWGIVTHIGTPLGVFAMEEKGKIAKIIRYCRDKKQGYPLAKVDCGYAEAGKDILGDKKWHLRVFEGARITGHDARYGYTFREGITLVSDEIFEVSE